MQPNNAAHLTPEQVLQAACDRLEDQNLRAHAEVCPACRDQISGWKAWLAELGLRPGGGSDSAGAECLQPEEVAELAIGSAGEGAESKLAHVAGCDRCGALLSSAMDRNEASPEEREFLAGLTTATPEWQHRMAARYTVPVIPVRRPALQWMPLAATVILSVGIGAWWMLSRASDPERLLARAFTEHRPFEYRLPDAGYGPVRQERSASGGTFARPEALTNAEEQIKRRLDRGVENAADLFLKGRAELLEGDYDATIASLTHGLDLKPRDAAALGDLGCAYALRGDVEKRNLDYGHAMEEFAESLRIDPAQPRAIYNQALVYQKLWLVDEAIDAWDRYLKLDPNGEWASEAKRKRAELEQVREHKKTLMELKKDPQSFLARLRTSPNELEPELYLDAFWANWLADVRADAVTLEAAWELGRVFAERFHDESVRDAVRDALAADAVAELRSLGQMLTDSVEERNDAAITGARKLIPVLEIKGQKVARLRTINELAYSYSRRADDPVCLDLLKGAFAEVSPKRYLWLTGQLHLQHFSCAGQSADLSAARVEADAVRKGAEANGLTYLAMKAAAAAGTADEIEGNVAGVWDSAPAGLREYWQTSASHFRGQQFVYVLRGASEAVGWKESAIVLERAAVSAAVRATPGSRNRVQEALNRANLSARLQDSGYYTEARQQLDITDALLRSAEEGPSLDRYRVDALLKRAAVEAVGTPSRQTLESLVALSKLPESSGALDRMHIYQAKGLAEAAMGRGQDAEASFSEAIRIHRLHLGKASLMERLNASQEVRESYRHLTDLQMTRDHNARAALTTWELYRGELNGGDTDGGSLAGNTLGGTAMVLAALPSGVAVWVQDSNGLDGRMVAASRADLESMTYSLARLAASPASDLDEFRLGSRKLREALVGHFEGRLSANRKLFVEADDWLAAIPFAALSDEAARYLGASHEIAMVSSLYGIRSSMSPVTFHSEDRGLIVSVSAPVSPNGRPLPVLLAAREEAADLARHMPRALQLDDETASPASIANGIQKAALFHFAGHGWANGGNGGLLLSAVRSPSDSQATTRWLAADEVLRQDWRSCRLAVLSACLTATGEDRGPVNNRSLVRAFLAAGAGHVVAARWSVDADATRALMKEFYKGLFSGASPAEALAAAESKIAASPGWRHPYYWAGFDVFSS